MSVISTIASGDSHDFLSVGIYPSQGGFVWSNNNSSSVAVFNAFDQKLSSSS